MESSNFGSRNGLRGESGRASSQSPIENTGQHIGNPAAEKAKGRNARKWRVGPRADVPAEKKSRRIKYGAVDAAWGVGHRDMTPEQVARGLARLARKGTRTAQMREIGGVTVVLSREIPVGAFALRTAGRITAYRSETATPIVEVLCEAADIPIAVSSGR